MCARVTVVLKNEVVAGGGYRSRNVCSKTVYSTAYLLNAMISVERNWQYRRERR